MIKVLLEADYAKVYVDTSNAIGFVTWLGVCSVDEYKSCFILLLEYQKKNPVKYFLSDIRQQGVINPQNRQWFQKVAMPQAVTQGLLKAAIVMDGTVFKRYYINVILQATKNIGLLMKTFDNEEKACDWLLE